MKHKRPILAVIVSLLAALLLVFTSRLHELQLQQPNAQVSLKEAAEAVSYTTGNGLFTRRFVIATAATHAYADFVQNLACSLAPHHMLVLALDAELYHEKMPSNVQIVHFDNGTATKERRFGSAEFATLSRRKLAAARAVLDAGYDVLFTDADVVFCDANAVHTIADSVMGVEMLVQRAAVRGQIMNTGLYYARTGASKLLRTAELWNKKGDDQWALNNVACERRYGGERVYEEDTDIVHSCTWNNETRVKFLDDVKFPLGCTKVQGTQLRRHDKAFVRDLCEKRQTALVHFSCWSGGNKRKSMAARGMWLVNKESSECESEQ